MSELSEAPGSKRRPLAVVACVACGASFWLVDEAGDVRLRCMGCRHLLRSGAHDDERWAYPLPEALIGGDPDPGADPTGVTLSLGEGGGGSTWSPRTIDRYVLHGELGRGGVGVVYDAFDPELGRHVALKVLASGAFASAEAVRRFRAEARAAAALEHPGIVGVLDVGMVDGLPYFTMRRVLGPSLEHVLRSHGPLPIREAARIALEVSRAVQRAHLGGVAHRDLKPGNVLLTCDGVPLVTDFGLAKVVQEDHGLTATEAVLGTPAYMAPEVARSARDVDWLRVDVYGLGALLHGALTGAGPSAGASRTDSMARASRGQRPATRALRPDVPWELEGILDVALCPEPGGRYASAGALGDDLERYLNGRVPIARPEGRLGRLRREARRHRVVLGVGLAVTVVTVGALAWPGLSAARAEHARQAAAELAWTATSRRIADEPSADRADTLFASFADEPAYQGTAALAKAWLARGDAAPRAAVAWYPENDVHSAALDAYARALAAAPDATLTAEALLRIGEWSLREANARNDGGSLLGVVTEVLASMGDVVPADRLAWLQLQLALSRADVEGAAAAWQRARDLGVPEADAEADPRWLGGLLRQGTKTPYAAIVARLAPTGPEGQTELVLWDDQHLTRVGLQPGMPGLQQVDFLADGGPSMDALPPVGDLPGGILTSRGALRFTDDGVVPLLPGDFGDGVTADLDGDGEPERYVADRRGGLARVEGDGPEATFHPLADGARKADSMLAGLAVGDLDGDGVDELAMGLGEWAAYDVRVYEDDGVGGLALRARAHRNATFGVLTMPDPWRPGASLLVSAETPRYAAARVFGTEDPSGPRTGLTVWRLEGDRLVDLWFRPSISNHAEQTCLVDDLDGDGVVEMFGLSHEYASDRAWVLRPGAREGQFEVATLWGLEILGTAQLDDDPEPEVLALVGLASGPDAHRDLWILGAGDTPVPPRPVPPPMAPLVAPDGLQAASLTGAWRAADVMARAGLRLQAAQALGRLAAMADPEVSATASVASGRLWQATGHLGRAAEAYVEAAQTDPVHHGDAWAAAVTEYLAAADPDAALRTAAQWRAADGVGAQGPLAAALARWDAARSAKVVFDPSRGAIPGTVLEPLAVDVASDGAVLRGFGTGRPLVRWPLERGDGPLALIVDAWVERFDWGGRLTLTLGLGDDAAGFAFSASGGGGLNGGDVQCNVAPSTWRSVITPRRAGATDPIFARLGLVWDPQADGWTCAVSLPDHDIDFVGTANLPPPAHELELDVVDRARTYGALVQARVARLEVWGATASTRAVPGLPEGDPIVRAVHAYDVGRPSEALAALREASEGLDEAAWAQRVPYLLRGSRRGMVALLREARGADFAEDFSRVWAIAIQAGTQAAEVHAALGTDLLGVSLPVDDPDGSAWYALGRRALDRFKHGQDALGAEEANAWLAAWGESVAGVTHGWDADAAELHMALALYAARRGDAATARAEADRARAVSPTPELVEDRLAIHAVWTSLKAD